MLLLLFLLWYYYTSISSFQNRFYPIRNAIYSSVRRWFQWKCNFFYGKKNEEIVKLSKRLVKKKSLTFKYNSTFPSPFEDEKSATRGEVLGGNCVKKKSYKTSIMKRQKLGIFIKKNILLYIITILLNPSNSFQRLPLHTHHHARMMAYRYFYIYIIN